jgi:hypothetical protein
MNVDYKVQATALSPSPPSVRIRVLCLYVVASSVVALITVTLLWPRIDVHGPQPLRDATFALILYGSLFALLQRRLSRSGRPLRRLLGAFPNRAVVQWAIGMGVAVPAFAVGLLYATFVPLSYVAPDFVRWWLFEDSIVFFWTEGDGYLRANAINFGLIVLLGPFVEETLFRGLLLPIWWRRLGFRWGAIWSSLAFAILHADILGGFVFGLLTALAFRTSGVLWVPLLIHITNNLLVWSVVAACVAYDAPDMTLSAFQEAWWHGLIGLGFGGSMLRHLLKRIPSRARGSPIGASQPVAPLV